jgi:hypothetical protein
MPVATEQIPIVVLPAHFLPGRAGHPSRPRALVAVPDRPGRADVPRRCPTGPALPRPPVTALLPLPGAAATRATRATPATRASATLTRRGLLALSVATAAAAAALVCLAWLSAPRPPAPAAPPARITVQPGDTLWSIATAVAPNRDPRDEVATLQRLNHLDGVSLAIGQVLRTR